MEKDQKQKKLKKICNDLPKISHRTLTKRNQKENYGFEANLELSPKIKNLRKLFFQYQSNARIIQNSSYYLNDSIKRQKLVQLINTKRYDLNEKIQSQIVKRYEGLEVFNQMNLLQKNEKKQLKIKLLYQDRVYSFKVSCFNCFQLTNKLKIQMAKIMFSLKGVFNKCDLLLCFQTFEQNNEVDFILSNPKINVTFLNQLFLKPVFLTKSFQQGQKVTLSDFKFIKCLGNGGFSTVFLAKCVYDSKYYAIKLINKNFIIESQRQGIVENQRFILGEFDSPFITNLEFSFETKNHFVIAIQCNFKFQKDCPGGELFYQLKKVKRMKQSEAKFYFLQILLGLDCMHSKNIIYRDLKPENLLIGIDGHIKIADFGLSKPLPNKKQNSHSFCGSPQYMAPEMLLKCGHNYLLDYYCLGALLYELVIGVPPYYSLDHEEIYASILNAELSFPSHVDLSQDIKSLLRGLLEKNCKKRLGCIFGIKEILLHPWVGQIKLKSIENKELIPPFIPNLSIFNFDRSDMNTDQQKIKIKIEEDIVFQNKFQTFFSEEFYFQNPKFKENMKKLNKIITDAKYKQQNTKKSQSIEQITPRSASKIFKLLEKNSIPKSFNFNSPKSNHKSQRVPKCFQKLFPKKIFNRSSRRY